MQIMKNKLQLFSEIRGLKARIEELKKREAELVKELEDLKAIQESLISSIQSSAIGTWDWDILTDKIYWSDEYRRLFGHTPYEQASYENWLRTVHPDDRTEANRKAAEAVRGKKDFNIEYRIVRPDGAIRWMNGRAKVFYDASGKALRMTGVCIDITERKKIEAELLESERLLSSVIRQSPHAIWISDAEGALIEINQACCKLLKIRREEVLGIYNIFKDNIVEKQGFMPLVRRVFEKGETARFQLRYDTSKLNSLSLKETTSVILEVTISAIKDAGGKVINAVIQHVDITERVRAEEELRKTCQLLEETQRSARVGGWEYDVATGRVTWTKEVYRIYGVGTDYDPNDISRDIGFYAPQSSPLIEKAFQQALHEARPYDLELEFIRKSGQHIWVRTTGRPEIDRGRVVRIFGIFMDITERKLAEEKIYLSESKFRGLFEHMASGVAVYEAVDNGSDFIFREFNPAAERIEKIEKEKVLGRSVKEVFPGVEEFGLFEVFKRVYRSGNPEYFPVALYKDNRLKQAWRENWVYKLPDGRIVSVYNDISERKRAEQELSDAKDYLDALINTIADPVFVKDKEHRFVLVNDALCRFIGRAREELINKTDYDFFPKEQADVFLQKDELVFDTGQENSNEESITDAEGNVYTIITKKSLYMDRAGNKFIVGIIRDITARKKAEEEVAEAYRQLKETQAQLIQSSKMSALGQLASGVAHEINNPLTGVLNNVQLIKLEAESGKEFRLDDFREILDVVEHSALRCKKIAQSLLDFSHIAKGKFLPVSLNEVAEKTAALVSQELKLQNVEFKKELQPDLPQILGDFQLLQQVVFGLITNAKWAIDKKTKEGGSILIRTWHEPGERRVGLSVTDSGIGIPAENIPKLFTPFFTTKDVGEGTGLGLALFYNIVKSHNGDIQVDSSVGAGTTFRVLLPY